MAVKFTPLDLMYWILSSLIHIEKYLCLHAFISLYMYLYMYIHSYYAYVKMPKLKYNVVGIYHYLDVKVNSIYIKYLSIIKSIENGGYCVVFNSLHSLFMESISLHLFYFHNVWKIQFFWRRKYFHLNEKTYLKFIYFWTKIWRINIFIPYDVFIFKSTLKGICWGMFWIMVECVSIYFEDVNAFCMLQYRKAPCTSKTSTIFYIEARNFIVNENKSFLWVLMLSLYIYILKRFPKYIY